MPSAVQATQASSVHTPGEVIKAARAMVSGLRERTAETEELRELPEASITEASAAGIFSLLLPRSLDGSAGTVHDFSDVMRVLAQGDPSAAWTIGFLTGHNWILARWPEQVQKEVFSEGASTFTAVVANPPGQAVPVEGGYLVTGRWGYCSGVMHADWVQIGAIIDGSDAPSWFLLPRGDVEVLDTWHMYGMQGSGSHDVKLTQQFVPLHREIDIKHWGSRGNPGAALHPEPLYSCDARDVLQFVMPSLVVGAAEALLELYRKRLDTRRAPFSRDLAGDTVLGQVRYARSVSALRAAKSLLDTTLDIVVENAQRSAELSDETRALIKLDCLTICRLARESIELGQAGSGSSIFKSSDITQHFLRDVQMILSHVTIDEDIMQETAGAILTGRATNPDPARNFT